MKRNIILFFVILCCSLVFTGLQANNIQISNVKIGSDNTTGGYAVITFDLSWENSWRSSSAPGNWDAAWLFVKYRNSCGEWQHARLGNTGHTAGTGTQAVIEPGLMDVSGSFNSISNPVVGCLVYRSSSGNGNFTSRGMQLRWDYSSNGLSTVNASDIRIFGLEMVFCPEGSFFVGDGVSTYTLGQVSGGTPVQVTPSGVVLRSSGANDRDDDTLEGGIRVDGDGGISRSSASETDMNDKFPTGYRGFYMMKYETSQGQYRDFLNTLSRSQQNERTATDISGTSVTNRFVMSGSSQLQNRNGIRCDAVLPASGSVEFYCDLDGDGIKNEPGDGQWLACNFINWSDAMAFSDWCGLRPATELEYEKGCRGPDMSVTGEYSWASATVATSAYSLSGAGSGSEGISGNYSMSGNALFSATSGSISGPTRVGITASHASNIGRTSSGSGYYGAMELSGNLCEQVVSLATLPGRNYTGEHGNGFLDAAGNANVSLWPDASGGGLRGGGWMSAAARLRVSDRGNTTENASERRSDYGYRGARSAVRSTIGTLLCGSATVSRRLVAGINAAGTSLYVPYSGGNGGALSGLTVTSSGVSGLTATLLSGNLADGGGNLAFSLSGTPAQAGTAVFGVNLGGQSCSLSLNVAVAGSVADLSCSEAAVTGTLSSGLPSTGVSFSLPYSGGNGGIYGGQSVASTGITGLTATLSAGDLATGSGSLIYSVAGTPSGVGLASFPVNAGGKSCTVQLAVTAPGSIGSIGCSTAVITGTLVTSQAALGVIASVPYTGGNGGQHNGQAVASTGVTGLAATLSPGTFANGGGNLTYSITGTPAGAGTASFALNIGGKTCTLSIPVSDQMVCRAKINATDYKNFMCHNLGAANTNADPFTPSWEINGGYWKWGSKEQSASGPTGPGLSEANEGAVSDWYPGHDIPAGFWSDAYKQTSDDPCPLGYRVPTKALWDSVVANNTLTNVGTWSWSATNYSSGKKVGTQLMLPAAGYRRGDGALEGRGVKGIYWSSTFLNTGAYWGLDFEHTGVGTSGNYVFSGSSVRCVAEDAIGSISCAEGYVNGNLVSGVTASSGESAVVPYYGGQGGVHSGQTVVSTGIAGLTATLAPGTFENGDGTLVYAITGTPASAGTASFALNIGGQTCTLSFLVAAIQGLSCSSATVTGTLVSGLAASGVSVSVPYTGGTGSQHIGQTVTSTEITGLTATLPPGTFANGGGNLTYIITGTPSGGGTAYFELNIGGQKCFLSVPVSNEKIESISCNTVSVTGSLSAGVVASGVSASVPYTGGNGGTHNGQTIASTGIIGLTATLSPGSFANGSGNLPYAITGTPAGAGTASFALNIGGKSCTLNFTVTMPVCRAKINATDYKNFMCHNVGAANTNADPFTPSWEINGGYWQWGRKEQAAAGPSGPGSSQANGGAVSGWNTSGAPNGAWSDASKSANDPCPVGYRVPTKVQWDAVLANNTQTNVGGTWSSSATNYTTGKKFGDQLMLPAAGSRNTVNGGALHLRGNVGSYWSSTEYDNNSAWILYFFSSYADMGNNDRALGYSVRCIAEDPLPSIGSISCSNALVSGSPVSGVALSGVSASVPYTAGNGIQHSGQTVISTGVTGLTATLAPGILANGIGTFFYTITGIPSGGGTASFALNIAGQTCTLSVTVASAMIESISCNSANITDSLTVGQVASGVSATVTYTGGNSGQHGGQTVASTGVTGLTATLSPGSFSNGGGNLKYIITGTPASAGTASFTLNIGGQTCALNFTVALPVCRAKINATDYKNFMCHNLGAANTSADPFMPSWEINGSYWQWGRKDQAAEGPTGPGSAQANDGAVSGWNSFNAPNGAWSDASKTANDPCPAGYRVPTKAQWDAVDANNTQTNVGTFSSVSATNYEAGKKFGNQLMLPAAGWRNYAFNLALAGRGASGVYWGSTENGSVNAWHLTLNSSSASTNDFYRINGLSVRCIAEDASIGSVDCGNTSVTGSLMAFVNATVVSAKVPYTGGNGGQHNGQTVTSTGVTGLTATLTPGTVTNGSGNLTYAITGNPAGAGTAYFALNIGGQTCTLNVTVAATVCRAKINATEYKNFMCHNLGAANTSADPFTPSWEINGGYWQWGRKDQAAAGPAGPGSAQANDGAVSGWNTSGAPDGAWSDAVKTANDPCPAGYRVPTFAQLEAIIANNVSTNVGVWSGFSTNYSSGKKLGDQLLLPAAGSRNYLNGEDDDRGYYGQYWSSSDESTSGYKWILFFYSSQVEPNTSNPTSGQSIRCIAEAGSIGSVSCDDASVSGSLVSGVSTSGASATIPYTGGNGGQHNGQTVTSAGVTGLTATLTPGTFANGGGNLTYTITGTPAGAGTASFALNIGGQTCTMNVTVAATVCRAKINATEYKIFMCHNLGAANTSADPFTPGWEINGGYWQWGRLAQAAAGPTGPGSSQANDGAVSGWNTSSAPNGAWSDASKTANDPCPAGYRVPTRAQWEAVWDNNTQTSVGTWTWPGSATNYSSGKKFGDQLMLPAAGLRDVGNGALFSRGLGGYYWSSTENVILLAWDLYFNSSDAFTGNDNRTYGLSVRCVAE